MNNEFCYQLAMYQVSCFYHKMHDSSQNCYISAPLKGNVTLMAQVAKEDFIFAFCAKLMLQSGFLFNNKVQTNYVRTYLNKNSRELRNNVSPTSKKLKFSRFLIFFMFRQKPWEKWAKNNPS